MTCGSCMTQVSVVTVYPHGFQEELGMRKRQCGEHSGAGWRQEVPVAVADTNCSFRFRLANITKPIVSVEGLVQAGCTTVISWTGRRCNVTPMASQSRCRRQRTHWLQGTIISVGELEVLTVAAVRTNPTRNSQSVQSFCSEKSRAAVGTGRRSR